MEYKMINPLNKYEGTGIGGHEDKKKIKVEKSLIDKVVDHYEKRINCMWNIDGINDDERILNAINEFKYVLSPIEIQVFLAIMPQYRDKKHFQKFTEGLLDKLVQTSYSHGYNNFTLDIDDFGKFGVLNGLMGTPKEPIRATINGSPETCATKSQYMDLTVNGNAGYLLGNAKNCRALIRGNAGGLWITKSSRVHITGNGADGLARHSTNITLLVNGNVGNEALESTQNVMAIIRGNTGYKFADGEKLKVKVYGKIDSLSQPRKSTLIVHGDIGEIIPKPRDSMIIFTNRKSYEKAKSLMKGKHLNEFKTYNEMNGTQYILLNQQTRRPEETWPKEW